MLQDYLNIQSKANPDTITQDNKRRRSQWWNSGLGLPPAFSFENPSRAFFILLYFMLIMGCSRDVVEETWPDGQPKRISSYSRSAPETPVRVRTFYYNGNPESDAHYRDGKLHGDNRTHWHNGHVHEKGAYRDGEREGRWEVYFNDFALSGEGLYRNGKQEGLWSHYWDDGSRKAEGSYRAGEKTGEWREWSRTGALLLVNSCFTSNDSGMYRAYHSNAAEAESYDCVRGVRLGDYEKKDASGALLAKGTYDENGMRFGPWLTYHNITRPESLSRFEAGLLQDSLYVWDAQGRLRERGHFVRGTGEVEVLDTTGRLAESKAYRLGLPDGEHVTYYPDGSTKQRVLYENGLASHLIARHANGRKASEGVYQVGLQSGLWKRWDARGALIESSEYVAGKRHGSRRWYDPKSGKVQRQLIYYHDYPASGSPLAETRTLSEN